MQRFFGYPVYVVVICCLAGIQAVNGQMAGDYQRAVQAWDSARIRSLTAPNGWVNLAGLFWLEEGDNRFGSDASNPLVFPKGKIAARAGILQRRRDKVVLRTTDTTLKLDGRYQPEAVVYDRGLERAPVMSYGSLRWTVIRRGNLIGVRLRDLEHPNLPLLTHIERYPVDEQWKVRAVLKPGKGSGTIAIRNVLGQVNETPSPGTLHFELNGKAYTLDALEEDGQLFVIFGDRTNGETTYPSGRFLYAKVPGADGVTELDFNKAYNPPCAFTPFATCPIPPVQNRLPIAITAGEQQVHLPE